MRQFDRWDMQEYPLPPTIERGPIGRDCLEQRKKAWRAALEWILGEANYCDDRPIREELGEE